MIARLIIASLAIATIAAQSGNAQEAKTNLAPGFVHLRSVDPTIMQAIRYAGPDNFTGKPVSGYQAAECVIVKDAAQALKRVQSELKPKGLGLKIFDCYRPVSAVAAFVRWAASEDTTPDLKQRYHPAFKRRHLFPGFIAKRSGHSRGGTVDLTLIDLARPEQKNEPLRDGCGPHEGGAELDMGTGFDCFDLRSQTASKHVSDKARRNRRTLVEIMQLHGFRNYSGEWWHFTLNNEPYMRTYFDFPVVAPKSRNQ
ncbi:MAG: M15 family metallopeptidase [Rhizobiaceae bacterium]